MAIGAEGSGWLAALFAVVVWVLCGGVPLAAQGQGRFGLGLGAEAQGSTEVRLSSPDVPTTADAVIEEMSRAAGVIFAGQVTAVRRPAGFAGSAEDTAEGIVEVDFRVDEAVRGPAPGSVYTLREWAGLWNASGGGDRYRVGLRLLVFLYEPDAHGLSSPVRGRDGALPLRGGGAAPGPDETTASAAEWMVDLRWVQVQALRREALLMLPVRRPVRRRPIGFVPEETIGREDLESTLVRRLRTPALKSTSTEMQPLTKVLAMCGQAMRRVDVAR